MSFPTRPNIFQSIQTHAHTVCKRTHVHAISPFVLTLLYFHKTRKANESSWCKCHEASHYGLLRWEEWVALTHTHTHSELDKMRMNYNERPEGHWRLLNKLKSQWFFNKSSPKANFCHRGLALWIVWHACLQSACLVQGYVSACPLHQSLQLSLRSLNKLPPLI